MVSLIESLDKVPVYVPEVKVRRNRQSGGRRYNPPKRFNEAEIAEMRAMYASGKSAYYISCKYHTTYHQLSRLGITGRDQCKQPGCYATFTDEDKASIKRTYDECGSVQEVCAKYQIGPWVWHKIAKDIGVSGDTIPKHKSQEIIENYKSGATIAELKKQHKVSYYIIARMLTEAGVALRRRVVPKIGDKRLTDIVGDYNSGLTVRQIESKYGIGWPKIKRAALQRGLQIRQVIGHSKM